MCAMPNQSDAAKIIQDSIKRFYGLQQWLIDCIMYM
jgi:hypothetical protein